MPPKRRLILTGLHGVISQKAELFIATAVRTLNATLFVADFSVFLAESI
jgi:hypothetical protein